MDTMKELALVLMTWISQNSAYDTASMPVPAIVEMSPAELTREAYADHPSLMPASGIDSRYIALYAFDDGSNGTVYVLGSKWTEGGDNGEDPLGNPVFQEQVLHELIHHVQRVSGAYKAYPCRNAGEKEAYLLGGRFLKQRYVEDPLPNRNILAHMYSRC